MRLGNTRVVGHVVAHHGADDIVLELVVAADDRIDRADGHQPAGSAKQERVDGHHPAFDALDLVEARARASFCSFVFFAAPRCVDGILEGKNDAAAAATRSW